jgi:D-glycero-alpha-D-manno-heptose 1-phosphate guanylyltransferase
MISNRQPIADFANTTVAILCGGLGSRLKSTVNDLPKAMAPIFGRPFLYYLFEWLIKNGAHEVVLCTGYRGDQIKRHFAEQFGRLRLTYSHEEEPLGTGGAIRKALSKIDTNDVLVVNGDTYCQTNLSDFISWHKKGGFNTSILLAYTPEVERYGSVEIDNDGYVIEFQEKSKRRGVGLVNAGIYYMSRSTIEEMPEDENFSLEFQVLPNLIGKGLGGYKIDTPFLDIGTPSSYKSAATFFRNIFH